jgi:hypothetical protein
MFSGGYDTPFSFASNSQAAAPSGPAATLDLATTVLATVEPSQGVGRKVANVARSVASLGLAVIERKGQYNIYRMLYKAQSSGASARQQI